MGDIKYKDGNVLREDNKIRERRKNYFNEMLNKNFEKMGEEVGWTDGNITKEVTRQELEEIA